MARSIRCCVSVVMLPRNLKLLLNVFTHDMPPLSSDRDWDLCEDMRSIYEPTLAVLTLILTQSLLLATASPLIQSPYVVKDNHPVPFGWEVTARAPGEQQIQLQIGLKLGQFDELERHLYEGMSFHLSPSHYADQNVPPSFRSLSSSIWATSFSS